MKQCRICHKWRDESEFYLRKDNNKYRNECVDCIQKYRKEYYQNNKKRRAKYFAEYRETHKEYQKKYWKKYCQDNKEKICKQKREYNKKRMRTLRKIPKYKLRFNISSAISRSLKKGKGKLNWEQLVGYSLQDLMKHLEKQFTQEMSWNNYGSFWWVDHVIPASIFNYDNYNHIDFKRCWALKNLRPLEKIENIKKNDSINKSFQPSLNI